ncbi:MAG: GYD domain-containing protein [Candidatus Bathyarchaeota archaeon]|nr:GYD domain-containing protein [Candidatus Bathyarchaeota archaeon]
MIFVNLGKFRKAPDKKEIGDTAQIMVDWKVKGINMLSWYWTLGRYDTVVVFEAANEKEAMKFAVGISEWVTTETLVAVPRQQAIELLTNH